MHVLVTGGAGYVGSRVVAHLLARGERVRVLDALFYGGEPLLALSGFPGFSLVVGDVRREADLRRALAGVDAVLHLAGIVGEAACNVNSAFTWSINREAIPGLVKAVAESGAGRLILISTCSNYGVAEPNVEVDETAPLKPLSDYARAKVAAEQEALGANGIPIAGVLRLGTICGLSARMRFDLLVNEMARDAALGRRIEIYAPAAWRPFLHIDDAAQAMARVLAAAPAEINRQVFNVVGENYQKTGLIEIARGDYPKLQVEVVDRRPDLRDYRVSGERFAEKFGFRPARTVRDAFRSVARAVSEGRFRDPDWKGHSAVPLDGFAAPEPARELAAEDSR